MLQAASDLVKALFASPRRTYFALLVLFSVVHVAVMWIVPILPAQDLPQHLVYARVLQDYDREPIFREWYTLPDHAQPYFTLHYILAALGKVVGLMAAIKFVASLYAVGMIASFHALVVAIQRPKKDEVPWTGLLGATFVYNPIFTLGVVQYAFTLPFLFVTIAAALRWIEGEASSRQKAAGLLAAFAMPAIHPASISGLGLVLVLVLVVHRTRTVAKVMSYHLGASLGMTACWMLVGKSGMTGIKGVLPFWQTAKYADDFNFIAQRYEAEWSAPLTKLSYATWTALGPHNWVGLALALVAALGCALVLYRLRAPKAEDANKTPSRMPRVLAAMAIVTAFVPWGLERPTEMTFIDLRLWAIVVIFGAATIPLRFVAAPRARLVLAAYAAFATGHVAVNTLRFGQEASAVLRLLDKVDSKGLVAAIPFDGGSPHFARRFRLTIFISVYSTVRSGAPSNQFWGKFTDHLPVDYQPEKHPKSTNPWAPYEFKPHHLEGADWLLLQKPDRDAPMGILAAAGEAIITAEAHGQRVACEHRWCLFRLERMPETAPAAPPEGQSGEPCTKGFRVPH